MLDTITGTDRLRPKWAPPAPQIALARLEGWRAVRHPALVLGAVVGALLSLWPWLDGVQPTQRWVNET